MIGTATIAKTLNIGVMMTANRPSASPRKPAPNILQNLLMAKPKTTEQLNAETNRFVIRMFSIALVFIVILFGYSIVFTEQPLFNEAPADKQIFTVLTLIGGQLLTILANYISKSGSTTPPSSFNHCPPMATTIKQEEKLITALEAKPAVPAAPTTSFFAKPNERPPL